VPGLRKRRPGGSWSSLGVEASGVKPAASFADLDADSLVRMELGVALEEAFRVEITDADAEKSVTVKNAVEYIQKNAKSVKQ
jgi:acyl carrier protein